MTDVYDALHISRLESEFNEAACWLANDLMCLSYIVPSVMQMGIAQRDRTRAAYLKARGLTLGDRP